MTVSFRNSPPTSPNEEGVSPGREVRAVCVVSGHVKVSGMTRHQETPSVPTWASSFPQRSQEAKGFLNILKSFNYVVTLICHRNSKNREMENKTKQHNNNKLHTQLRFLFVPREKCSESHHLLPNFCSPHINNYGQKVTLLFETMLSLHLILSRKYSNICCFVFL